MIGIITYDAPHRKTQDILYKLLLNGYTDIHLIVIPWVERKKTYTPIYQHRPSKSVSVTIEDVCSAFHIDFTRVEVEGIENLLSKMEFDHLLIAGAGILPASLARNYQIINGHPGYLPNVRGLDALKWAIYDGQPIGVTTHFISEEADEGQLIERRMIPLYFEDSFHNLAYRMYETEIEMLVNAIKIIDAGEAGLEDLADDRYTAHRRMPHHLEVIMMERFEALRKASKSHRS